MVHHLGRRHAFQWVPTQAFRYEAEGVGGAVG